MHFLSRRASMSHIKLVSSDAALEIKSSKTSRKPRVKTGRFRQSALSPCLPIECVAMHYKAGMPKDTDVGLQVTYSRVPYQWRYFCNGNLSKFLKKCPILSQNFKKQRNTAIQCLWWANIQDYSYSVNLVDRTKQVSRFRTPFVEEHYKLLCQQRELLSRVCNQAWLEYLDMFNRNYTRYHKAVRLVAVTDCLMSLATVAKQPGYCR